MTERIGNLTAHERAALRLALRWLIENTTTLPAAFDCMEASRVYNAHFDTLIDWHEFSHALDVLHREGVLEIAAPGGYTKYRLTRDPRVEVAALRRTVGEFLNRATVCPDSKCKVLLNDVRAGKAEHKDDCNAAAGIDLEEGRW